MEVQIHISGEVDHSLELQIEEGLARASNTAPPRDFFPLCIRASGSSGETVGALTGSTYWGWLHIRLLWVSDDRRRNGLGSTLVRAAEEEARLRGCKAALVDTFDFQAPSFYQKLGYSAFATLHEFPPGHSRIYYQKQL